MFGILWDEQIVKKKFDVDDRLDKWFYHSNTVKRLLFDFFHSVANTSMPQIFVAYTSITRVSSFENGRNQMIIS